ncbi:MAG TPA: LLM class flavin-dependent oxidoreductase [Ktedonobacterales bacterium]
MRFGISLPPFAEFSDPLFLADVAAEAESAGWDGFFPWDNLVFDATFHPIPGMWVALSAVATRTQRMKIGPMVTALPRRHPWDVAREAVSLDHLSRGRLILGVGLGLPPEWEFGAFHQETDAILRGEMLDESLAILDGLWSGEPFQFSGKHYQIEEARFLPRPKQQPRIPIWVAGVWPNKRPFRRAARYDGVFPIGDTEALTPETWREIFAYVQSHRTHQEPFEYVTLGRLPEAPDEARAIIAAHEAVGVTWWLESIHPWALGKWDDPWTPEATQKMIERIRQGPPTAWGG